MGHSSLLGIDRADAEPAGRDTAALGPSDSSDSGSDVAGIDELDVADPTQPVDVAMRDDVEHALMPGDILSGGASDAAGTGERRSAGSDAGHEAADIGVDRIFDPDAEVIDDEDEDEDPDLSFIDRAEAGEPLEDENEDPVGDGRTDAAYANAQPPAPGRSNPSPDSPADPEDEDDEDLDGDEPDDEGDVDEHRPGRD